jgi:thiamine biosynthesis lipoprotein
LNQINRRSDDKSLFRFHEQEQGLRDMAYREMELMFSAMNTEIKIVAIDPKNSSIVEQVRELFAESEQRFSRFIESSELSSLNSSGELINASNEMITIIESCVRHHERTNGVFDPVVLSALELAGYDRSFELLNGKKATVQTTSSTHLSLLESLSIDRLGKRITTKSRLDLGGIAKGWTVDRASELMSANCSGWLIDAGGDMFCGGISPDESGWIVGIDDPFTDGELVDVVHLDECAIATSSTVKRSWTANGERRHHIIDPSTGQASSSELAAVSVIAETAELADVLAKCAVILGESAARELLHESDAEARFTRNDGTFGSTHNWPSILTSISDQIRTEWRTPA